MTNLADSRGNFTELQLLRNRESSDFDQQSAIKLLNRIKTFTAIAWKNSYYCTTSQIAEWYEVAEDTIQTAIKNNRSELKSDGLRILKGKELKLFKEASSNDSFAAPTLTVWSPKAMLRLGLYLRNSVIAKSVRDLLGLPHSDRQITFTEYDIQMSLNKTKRGTREKQLPSKRRIDIVNGEVIIEVKRGLVKARHIGQLFEYLHETGLKEGNIVGCDIDDCAMEMIKALRKLGYLITFTKFNL